MMKRRMLLTWLAPLALGALAPLGTHAETPWAEALAAQTLDSGFLSRLPPKLSKTLGLAKPEEGTEVRQLISRSGHHARTFNVSVANHNDIVMFSVDIHTNDSVAYLIGPDGKLRKALAYQHVDQERPLTAGEAQSGFRAEKSFWSSRLHKPAAKPGG
jgi:hypothetical protein